ncbi:hypothetical protein LJR084_001923 [Variovorax sp. LjRoot84]|uniref:hypothetical protein n=1 Tax=Variovorax sp. LjRoot84 TaxID=3342340 RepID=UPI003ECD1D3F
MTGLNVTMMEETPSAQVVKAANAEHVVVGGGRRITLKRPGVLAQFKVVEMLGGAAASNGVFMGMVFPILYVVAIDGDPVPRCTTRLELEALIQRLDEDGVAAVMNGVEEHWGNPDPEKDKAAVKN